MNTRPLIPLLLVGAFVLACGTRSHSEAVKPATKVALASSAESPAPAPAPVRRIKLTDTGAPDIHPAFVVSTAANDVHFALDVTNGSKRHVELAFASGQQYDFTIVDTAGKEVYRWGSGRMFTQSLQYRTLDGGDTMHIEEHAAPPLGKGSYVAVATLRSSNFPIQQRVPFELR